MNARLHAEVAPRALLWLNHVLLSEPAAMERLRPHHGKRIAVVAQGLPALFSVLGPWPEWHCRITPAGLFEAVEEGQPPPADLVLTLVLGTPVNLARQALQGERPEMHLSGDSLLAGELDWLSRNLRWDVADDLQRLIGPGPAQAATKAAAQVGEWLRQLSQAAPGPRA